MKKEMVLGASLLVLLTGCESQDEDENIFKTTKEPTRTSQSTTVNKTQSSEVSSEVTSIEKRSTHTEESEKAVKTALWNQEKSAKLADFMSEWGRTMNQTHLSYSPGNDVDLYGLALPSGVFESRWTPVIANTPIQIVWSQTGEEPGTYAAVACYSNADSGKYLEKYVYLFTILDGEPQVLVTSQNQGNPNDYLYFRVTGNNELATGFADIIKG